MNTICFIMIIILQHCNENLIGNSSFIVVILLVFLAMIFLV